MEATQMDIDFKDKVAVCRGIDCPPFPIVSKRARVHVPSMEDAGVRFCLPQYEPFLKGLEALDAKMASVYAASSLAHTLNEEGVAVSETTDAHASMSNGRTSAGNFDVIPVPLPSGHSLPGSSAFIDRGASVPYMRNTDDWVSGAQSPSDGE
eukprot:scaffold12363_cov23-Cyclotella_meneghiniana.AAC.3